MSKSVTSDNPDHPAFVVIEVESFPVSARQGSIASIKLGAHGSTAVLAIQQDLPLRGKIKALRGCADYLEQRLTPDGTGYWDRELKLVAQNDTPTRSTRKAPKLTLAVTR